MTRTNGILVEIPTKLMGTVVSRKYRGDNLAWFAQFTVTHG